MTKKPQFCRLWHEVLDSDAVLNLSSGAGWLLIGIFRRHDGFNNGQIVYSKRDAMKWCHCGSDAARHYFKELETAGLVSRTKKGRYHLIGDISYCTSSTWRLNFKT
jgi:hypothetical protein